MDDDSNAPATKADIAQILTAIRAMQQNLEDFKGEVRTELRAIRQDAEDFKGEVRTELRAIRQDAEDFKGEVRTEFRAIRQDLEDFKVEVNMRFQEFEHRMEQNLLDSEGRIITSNYRLADSIQQRLAQTESNQAALIGRLATIEARLTDLERRANTPPQAQ